VNPLLIFVVVLLMLDVPPLLIALFALLAIVLED
jgi:hypothetical protein